MDLKFVKRLIGLYLIAVGASIIAVWIIFFSINFIPRLNMDTSTLVTHVIAEVLAGILAITGGILTLLRKRYALAFSFLGEGALFYAILNIIGYYMKLKIVWLTAILIPTLVLHTAVILVSLIVLNVSVVPK